MENYEDVSTLGMTSGWVVGGSSGTYNIAHKINSKIDKNVQSMVSLREGYELILRLLQHTSTGVVSQILN